MCDAKATSREHVPPLCLFPEKKDIDFVNLRENLITVPSCELHNSKKSKDDEFLLACMAGLVGNNSIAFIHNATKVKRMIERYGDHFIEVFNKNAEHKTFKTSNGLTFPIAYGMPDIPRLIRCFEHIAYGLYYHVHKERFNGTCKVIPSFVNYTNANMRALVDVITRRYAFHEKDNETAEYGNNPLVFQYWMVEPDKLGISGRKMTFYEGADVFVAFKPKELDVRGDLVSTMIKEGIKVHVTFPDGAPPVEFN